MKRNLEKPGRGLSCRWSRPAPRASCGSILDMQLADRRSAWDMQPDGSYVQRTSTARDGAICIHRTLIDRARKRLTTHQRAGRKKKAGDRSKE